MYRISIGTIYSKQAARGRRVKGRSFSHMVKPELRR